ncbi:MAG: glycosyltransferase [Muribaculaceae bacterium]
MKISIITITRDNLGGLKKTVASVRGQSLGRTDDKGIGPENYVEIEHIVVDGESTDGSAEWLAGQDGLKIVSAPPRGVYHAINRGMEAAGGEVLMLMHAGDVFASDDVVRQVAAAFADESLDFVFGDLHYVNAAGRTVRRYSGSHGGLKALLHGYAPPHPTLAVRARTQHAVGLYGEDYVIAGDFEMFGRLFCRPGIKYLYLPLDMVEMEAGGISSAPLSRLWINNREKLRALRRCGLPASMPRVLSHYFYIVRNQWKK